MISMLCVCLSDRLFVCLFVVVFFFVFVFFCLFVCLFVCFVSFFLSFFHSFRCPSPSHEITRLNIFFTDELPRQ